MCGNELTPLPLVPGLRASLIVQRPKEFKPGIALRPVVVAGGGAGTATMTIPLAGFAMVGDYDRPPSPPQVSPPGFDAVEEDRGLLHFFGSRIEKADLLLIRCTPEASCTCAAVTVYRTSCFCCLSLLL